MKFGVFLSIVFVLVLSGCATPVRNAVIQKTEISKPAIGSVNTTGVGEPMLVQGLMLESEAMLVEADIKSGAYLIPAGKYLKSGQNEKGQYFSVSTTTGAIVQKNPFADPFQATMITPENQVCVVTTFNVKSCSKETSGFSVVNISAHGNDSFQQTLIYSGKVGNKINVGYREFSSNVARPAFNNDVEYDLNESKQIGYKGALLDIVDATNQSITYKVLKNFTRQ